MRNPYSVAGLLAWLWLCVLSHASLSAATVTAMVQRASGAWATNSVITLIPSNTPSFIAPGGTLSQSVQMRVGTNGWASNNLVAGNYRFNIDQSTRDVGVVNVPAGDGTYNLFSLLTSTNWFFDTNIYAFITTVKTNGVAVGNGKATLNFIGATGMLSGTEYVIGGFSGSSGSSSFSINSNATVIATNPTVIVFTNIAAGVNLIVASNAEGVKISAALNGITNAWAGTNFAAWTSNRIDAAITNNHSVAVSLNTNLNVGGTNGAAFAFVTNDLKVGGGFEAADIGAGAQFVVTEGDGTLTIGGNELTAGPGKVEARLAGPVGFSLWDDTFVGDDALMWKVFGNGNQTNRGSIGIARGALITGPITNVSLTASKIVLSDGNKALASSTLAESDIYTVTLANTLSNRVVNAEATNATQTARLDALDSRAVTNENSTSLQINNGTLTLSPGTLSNLVNGTLYFADNQASNTYAFASNNSLYVYVSNTLAFVVRSNGFVGIGTNAPGGSLDVQGKGIFSDNVTGAVLTASSGGVVVGVGQNFADVGRGQFRFSGIGVLNFNANNLVTTGNIGIGTTTPISKLDVSNAVGSATGPIFHAGTNLNNGITVDTNGNVGIGTNSPQAALHVSGGGIIVHDRSSSSSIGIGTVYSSAIASIANDLYIDRPSGKSLSFTINGTGTEHARFDSSGRLGIGTTTPLAKLHVSGGHVATETNAFPTFCTNGMTTLWNSNGTVFLVTSRRAGTNQTFTFLAAEP